MTFPAILYSTGSVYSALAGLAVAMILSIIHICGVQRVYLNGQDVSEEIRTPEVSMGASAVAALDVYKRQDQNTLNHCRE